MGSDVITKVTVSCMAGPDGRVWYLAGDDLYDKKDGPKYGRWRPRFFGPLSHVLTGIFDHAAVFEGGLYQRPRANSSALDAIAMWRRKLARPTKMQLGAVSIDVGTRYFQLHPELVPAINVLLGKHGLPSMTDQLKFDPNDHPELLFDLSRLKDVSSDGKDLHIPASELFKVSVVDEPAGFGEYKPKLTDAVKFEGRLVHMVCPRFGSSSFWLENDAGLWRHMGSSCQAVEALMKTSVVAAELSVPGSAEGYLCGLKVAMDTCRQLTSQDGFLIRALDDKASRWIRSEYQSLAAYLGLPEDTPQIQGTFDMTEEWLAKLAHVAAYQPIALSGPSLSNSQSLAMAS